MKKKLLPFLLLLLLALIALLVFWLVTRPNGAPQSAGHVTIVGFSQLGSESGWRAGNSRDVIAAAERGVVASSLRAKKTE